MYNQPYNTAPQSRSSRKPLLIIGIVVVVLCCLCTAVGIGGAAVFYFWNKPAQDAVNLPSFSTEEAFPVQETSFFEEDTPEAESTPIPEDTPVAEEEPTATPEDSGPGKSASKGLGVSRAEMIEFYSSGGAFAFGDPTVVQGLEMVQGFHSWLCIDSNCAAVTLGGPEDELQVISIVVPTKPADSAQTTLGVLLLMTTAARFTDAQSVDIVPKQIMDDILAAQKAGENLDKQIESSGFVFSELYDAKTHNAGLAVSRPK